MPRSLAGRMVLAFVGVIAVAMLALGLIVPGLERAHQLAVLEDRLADEAIIVADYVIAEMSQGRTADIDQLVKRLGLRSETRITIIAPDGTVIGESDSDLSLVGNHASRSEVQQALAGNRGVDVHYSETVRHDMLYVAVPMLRDGKIVGVSRTALSLDEIDRLAAEQSRAILLAALGSGMLALCIALLAARAIGKPLAGLTRRATHFAANPTQAGHFPHFTGPAELTQLNEALQSLANAVGKSLARVSEERDRLEAVLANLADGIVIIDADGRVTRLNEAAQALLDIRTPELGRTVAETLRDHELIDLVEKVQSAPYPASSTTFLERRQPNRLLQVTAGRFEAGATSQTLVVMHDLTQLRRLENVRRDFIANVSHELRTPIASIKIMTETLQDGAIDDPTAARDFLARIEQEVDGLHHLVEELLELSRLESGRVAIVLAAVDPAALVRKAVDRLAAMAERANVSLRSEVADDLPPVMADADRMSEVLVNLIHNAIKFTPAGGWIVIRAAKEGNGLRITVADNGAGIPAELMPRIFERFYKGDKSRADGGTGLGLAIAKHTVQLHSGRIWAESRGPGHGTAVHVFLPMG